MKKSGGRSADPALQEKQKDMFMECAKKKPLYQKQSLELYGFKLKEGELRASDIVMREAYLDFYTKSL